jgi:hypothetical protein
MGTILRLHFNPADNIFPAEYQGNEFIDITDPVYIPKNGDAVYFEAAAFINDVAIADKLVELMDYEGLKVNIWRVDYQSTGTVISGLLTSTANFKPF